MTYKSDIQHFEAPTLENDLGRLNEQQILDQQKFTKRSNQAYAWVKKHGMPPGYAEYLKEFNEALKRANAGPINFEEVYALDQSVSETIWDADVFSQMGLPTVTMTKPRFTLKDYLVQSDDWPRFTTTFRNPTFIRMKESSQFSNGIGLACGYAMPFTQIRESEGGLWSPQAVLMREAAAKMGLQKSRRGFLGSSCANASGDDGGDASNYAITGLYNYASVQTAATGIGADNNVQDQGDLEASVKTMLADLKKVYQPGKIYIVSSSGIASHLFIERDTYTQTLDYNRVKDIMSILMSNSKNAQWGGWWVTEQLKATAMDSTHQRMVMFKASPQLMSRHIIYPQQTLPLLNKMYEGDLQEVQIFADIFQVKKIDTTNNAVPITTGSGDITTDGTGFIPDGTRIF